MKGKFMTFYFPSRSNTLRHPMQSVSGPFVGETLRNFCLRWVSSSRSRSAFVSLLLQLVYEEALFWLVAAVPGSSSDPSGGSGSTCAKPRLRAAAWWTRRTATNAEPVDCASVCRQAWTKTVCSSICGLFNHVVRNSEYV